MRAQHKKRKKLAHEEFHDEVGSLQEYPYSLADCLAHVDHITSAVLSVYCGKVQQITAKCCRQRNLREIGTRSAAGKEKGSKLLETSAALFIGTEASCSSQTDRRERDGARTATNVIHQLGHQLMSVGGSRKEYCSVSARLNWKR